MGVVLVNCVLLAMDDSTVAPESQWRSFIDTSDYFFAAIFLAEMCMKMVAWGVWGCGHT